MSEENRNILSWISVYDNLPEANQNVLGYVMVDCANRITEVFFDHRSGWSYANKLYEHIKVPRVTHWTPIPNKPENLERTCWEK